MSDLSSTSSPDVLASVGGNAPNELKTHLLQVAQWFDRMPSSPLFGGGIMRRLQLCEVIIEMNARDQSKPTIRIISKIIVEEGETLWEQSAFFRFHRTIQTW